MELWQVLIILLVGLAAFLIWKYQQQIRVFLLGVRDEVKQVSWPGREELVGSALVVFVGVALLGAFIGVCDFFLSKAAQLLLR